MFKTVPALAALAVSVALVVPTVAQAQESNSARVSYADLDLASQLGQSRLQKRIVFAAHSVCDTADAKQLKLASLMAECRTGAIAGAQPAYAEAVAKARRGTVEVLDTSALIITAPR
jgi:UrcA family protein